MLLAVQVVVGRGDSVLAFFVSFRRGVSRAHDRITRLRVAGLLPWPFRLEGDWLLLCDAVCQSLPKEGCRTREGSGWGRFEFRTRLIVDIFLSAG